jgi:hypothetical protein
VYISEESIAGWLGLFSNAGHRSLKSKSHQLILIIKPTRCTNFSNFFLNETLRVSDSSSVHHQELFTVHSAVLLESCLQSCMTYTIAVCTMNNSWLWTEELSETCSVSFQNKFEKLVHLNGFIIRICHYAQSHERKIHQLNTVILSCYNL